MQLSINNQSGGIINFFKDTSVTIHQSNGRQTIDVHSSSSKPECQEAPLDNRPVKDSSFASDYQSDTSFFTSRFPEETTKKNILEAIAFASSKADVCRRIMALETQGYIILSNVGDDRKAELINPYAQPKFTLTGEDFKKARNRR